MKRRILLAGSLAMMLAAAAQSYGAQMEDWGTSGVEAFMKGNYREAERYYREAWQKADSTGVPATERASTLGGLAMSLLAEGRFADSEGFFNRALAVTQQEVLDPRIRPALLSNLAALYTQTDRYIQAEPLLTEALTLGDKTFGPKSAFVAGILKNLGIVYANTARVKTAEATLKKALALAEKQAGPHPQEFASIQATLAAVYMIRKKWNQAESLQTQAVDFLERSVGPDHPNISDVLSNLGRHYALQGKWEQAETTLRRALSIRQKTFGPDNIGVAQVSCTLASVLTAEKKYAEANALFLSSLPIQERVFGPKSRDFVAALEEFATLLRKMENSSQAETVEARARNIRFDLMYTVPASQLGK